MKISTVDDYNWPQGQNIINIIKLHQQEMKECIYLKNESRKKRLRLILPGTSKESCRIVEIYDKK